MPEIAAPTGDESPREYYGSSSYLDQVDLIKAEVVRANAEGRDPNLDGFHPNDIAASGVVVFKSSSDVGEDNDAKDADSNDGEPTSDTPTTSVNVKVGEGK